MINYFLSSAGLPRAGPPVTSVKFALTATVRCERRPADVMSNWVVRSGVASAAEARVSRAGERGGAR